MPTASEQARLLYPYLLPFIQRAVSGKGGSGGGMPGIGGAPSPHDLESAHHTGLLASSQAPQFLLTSGARPLTGNWNVDPGITIDGVDLSVHVADPDAHHPQIHNIISSNHTVTGAAFQIVGTTATDTLGLLTASSNPGATSSILRTDSNGALQLDTNLLYVDAVNNNIGINRTPAGAALDVLSAVNADHTLRVKQKSGQIGRLWRVEDSSGNELIVMDSQGNLQSGMPGFVSGLTGWQISHLGNAEFNNIWARGELHATIFVKDEIHATGGTLLVASAGKLYSDALIDSTTVDVLELELVTDNVLYDGPLTLQLDTGDVTLEIEDIFNFIEIDDPPSGPGFYFHTNDVVRSKTEVPTGVTDFWLEIRSEEQLDGYSSYGVIKRSGTDGVLPAGSAVVSYGVPGDGRVLLTSDLNYAPYIDVFTVGPNVWTGAAGSIIPHVRLGRLDGVGVAGTSGIEQYGMIAGTDLSNANSPYIVASNLQLRLHKVDLTANDGTNDTVELTATGNFTLGSNIGTDAGKSFQVITTGADAGDVIMGHVAGSYVHFDESADILRLSGSLEVGVDGHINSIGKDTYADTEPGFFMGWDTDDYKLNIGSAQSHLRWDGSALSLSTEEPLRFYYPSPGVVMFFDDGLAVSELSYGVTVGNLSFDGMFSAEGLISTSDRIIIEDSLTPANSSAAGAKGTLAYDGTYMYFCIAVNTWRRFPWASWSTF